MFDLFVLGVIALLFIISTLMVSVIDKFRWRS